MTTLIKAVAAVLFTILFVTLPMTASAADPKPVLEVLYFNANGDIPGLLAMVGKANEIAKEIHPKRTAKYRVFMLDFAGDRSGTVALVIEHPSYSEWAKGREIVVSDPRWAEFSKQVQAAGYKLLSRGLSTEIGRFN